MKQKCHFEDALVACTAEVPQWSMLIGNEDSCWIWNRGKLFHQDAIGTPLKNQDRSKWKTLLVKYVYADQNSSANVRKALQRVHCEFGQNDWGLNLGAGSTRFHERILNLDLNDDEGIDIVSRGEKLPFKDDALKLVISQEVLEHVADPSTMVAEVLRVLKPGGLFYCQIPFIIGYHPGPHDYWRFSKEGLARLFIDQRWKIEELDIALGHGSGFYRIAVEYFAVNCSVLHPRIYLPAKGMAALLFLPFKIPDLWSRWTKQRDRIPGGYYCITRKASV